MFHMDPKQVDIKAYSANQAGWAGLSLDGKTVFSRSSREIREAFADVTQKLEKAIEDLQKAREEAAAAAAAPADGAQPSTASAGATPSTTPSGAGSRFPVGRKVSRYGWRTVQLDGMLTVCSSLVSWTLR